MAGLDQSHLADLVKMGQTGWKDPKAWMGRLAQMASKDRMDPSKLAHPGLEALGCGRLGRLELG